MHITLQTLSYKLGLMSFALCCGLGFTSIQLRFFFFRNVCFFISIMLLCFLTFRPVIPVMLEKKKSNSDTFTWGEAIVMLFYAIAYSTQLRRKNREHNGCKPTVAVAFSWKLYTANMIPHHIQVVRLRERVRAVCIVL